MAAKLPAEAVCLVNEIAAKLKELTALLVSHRNTPMTDRLHKRMVMASAALPVDLVEETGMALFEFRVELFSDDPQVWAKFLNPDDQSAFAGALDKAGKNADMARQIITTVQDVTRRLSEDSQRDIVLRARHIFDTYLKYTGVTDPGEE